MTDLHHLTDDEVIARIATLNGVAKEATAALVAHLAELESRDLHLALGEDENHLALLGGAIHKSKVEVKELLAAWFPKADVATSIRRTATPAGAKASGADIAGPGAGVNSLFSAAPAVVNDLETNGGAVPSVSAGQTCRKATIDPLSAETYALRLTARRATIERLRRAQEILSHTVPDGDVDEILYRALGVFIETKERHEKTSARRRRNRADRTIDPTSRTVSAEVERQVRQRDRDQCAFVSRDGRRCEERRFLELHHLKPWIAGGGASARNIALRCRAHNQYEWKVYVAPIRMAREVMTTR